MTENCNTCESKERSELFKIGEHRIVKCGECNLVYIENPMTPQQAKNHYEVEYYTGENGVASTSCYGSGEDFRIKEANRRIAGISGAKSLLDVGCGMGFFIKAANERGINAKGIDLSQNAVDYGRSQGLDLTQGDLLNMNGLESQSFDVITFWASLEHLYKPRETLKKAYELLAPNGIIIVETGDVDSYLSRLTKNKWRLLQPDHNFYFSSKTLDDVLGRVGFDVFKTENDGFVESIVTQFGLRNFVLNQFSKGSSISKRKSSSLKEIINTSAGKLQLGDVMIKHARK